MNIFYFFIFNFFINLMFLGDLKANISSAGFLDSLLLFCKKMKNRIFHFSPYAFFQDVNNYKNKTLKSLLGFSNLKVQFELLKNKLQNADNRKQNFLFLIGPDGMRKDDFAFAFANEMNLPILYIKSNVMNLRMDIQEWNYIFDFLKKNAPCIMYLDDCEELFRYDYNKMNNFVDLIDYNLFENKNIILILGDKRLENQLNLFDKKIDKEIFFFDLIEDNDLIEIILFFLKKYDLKLQVDDLINSLIILFKNMTIDDIESKILNIKYLLNSDKRDIITDEDIKNIIYSIENDKKIKFGKDENKNKIDYSEYVLDKNLDDIWGYKDIKKKLSSLLSSVRNKNKKQKGILLSGPAGVGKTQMIRAFAGSSKVKFISTSPSKLLSAGGAEISYHIDNLFLKARLNAPCILFIDEIDVLLENKMAMSSFLIQLDGVESLLGVTVIGATNYSDLIDRRIKRSGRMSIEIKIPLPNQNDRKEIIENYLSKKNVKLENDLILNQLVERTNNFSGAEIEDYVYNIKTYLEENNIDALTSDILFNVFIDMILGSKKELLMGEKELIQVAYHEACHGLLQYILYRDEKNSCNFSFLTIEPRENSLGVSVGVDDEYYAAYSKEYLESDIKISLAGKAGQEVFFNKIDAGAISDLEQATQLAYLYVDKLGMDKKLSVKSQLVPYDFEQSPEIINAVEKILQQEYKIVKQFLSSHKGLVDNIVKELLNKKLLDRLDLEKIIFDYEKLNKKIQI